ncbi:hypothetical protein [Paenibacillus silvae]|uniref:Uncharacterized protein n=1 Tax=Paenibacillus silvae TaxID=1325358 RepID=A0A2W6NAL4_9BACL|nr:hypothetical protein [Paenibacillus silvae]PZT51988.1 hypothetical protein DN757_29620 [Paenibacillus silvae]
MNLNNMVNDAMQSIKEEGIVEQIVRKKIEKTLESIVDDVFSSYSEFGKSLKEAVKENLNVDISRLDLPSYNTLVLQVVKEKLDVITHTQGVEKLKHQMDELLADVKPEYKLSELIEKWKESESEYEERDGEEFSLHIGDSSYSSTWVHLDPEPDTEKYQCRYAMLVRDDATVSCLKIDDKEINAKKIMYGLDGPGKDLFKIYAHGSKLLIDKDQVDLYYGNDY